MKLHLKQILFISPIKIQLNSLSEIILVFGQVFGQDGGECMSCTGEVWSLQKISLVEIQYTEAAEWIFNLSARMGLMRNRKQEFFGDSYKSHGSLLSTVVSHLAQFSYERVVFFSEFFPWPLLKRISDDQQILFRSELQGVTVESSTLSPYK